MVLEHCVLFLVPMMSFPFLPFLNIEHDRVDLIPRLVFEHGT